MGATGSNQGLWHSVAQSAKRRERMDWIFYMVVGIAIGLAAGYMIGIRRGAAIVGMLLSGVIDGIEGAKKG